MSYLLQAIIARSGLGLAEAFTGLSVVSLPQGLVMAPLTKAVRERIGLGLCPLTDDGAEPRLPASVIEMLCGASRGAKAAYVEAELFGGAGLQACLLAEGGEVVDATIYVGPDAINQALAFLGVTAGPSQDEFEAVQLGKYRRTDDWVERGLTTR